MTNFKLARLQAGLTQAAIAEKMGVTVATVSLWDNGQTTPRPGKLPALAELMGCSIVSLIQDSVSAGAKDTDEEAANGT